MMMRLALFAACLAALSACQVQVKSTNPETQTVLTDALGSAGITVAKGPGGAIANGSYGDGLDGFIEVKGGQFQYGSPGQIDPWRPVSQLEAVGPDVVRWKGAHFCSDRLTLPRDAFPGKYQCTALGYVDGATGRLAVPANGVAPSPEAASGSGVTVAKLRGQKWTCRNCSGTVTMDFYPNGRLAYGYRGRNGFQVVEWRYRIAGPDRMVFTDDDGNDWPARVQVSARTLDIAYDAGNSEQFRR